MEKSAKEIKEYLNSNLVQFEADKEKYLPLNMLEEYIKYLPSNSLKFLKSIVSNIKNNPTSPKLRKLKLSNKTLKENVFNNIFARALLVTIGFIEKENSFLELDMNVDLTLLERIYKPLNDTFERREKKMKMKEEKKKKTKEEKKKIKKPKKK